MKILTIGVYGIPGSVDSDLVAANVFEDYDAVIVNPDSLTTLYSGKTMIYDESHHGYLEREFASDAQRVNIVRHRQVRGLMQKNGLIICFLQPLTFWRDAGRNVSITNYDWLFDIEEITEQFHSISYGTGTTINYIDPNHPFTEYLQTKPHWKAYIQKTNCNPKQWRTLASAFDTHLLSIASTTNKGRIIFLPAQYNSKNGNLLKKCILKLLVDKSVTPVPQWAVSIRVPGQDELIKRLTDIDTQIKDASQQRDTLISTNQELESWKWLLYETGKHRLEPIVHKALSLLGCQVDPQPDSDSDGKVTTEFGIALLEIEGTNESIKVHKISQLLRNLANFLSEEGLSPKGILIGNPFRLENLSNRPPKGSQKKLFSDEVLKTAERHDISVLLSTDLYEIVCLILNNKLTTRQITSLRKRIFQGKGLVSLSVR